MDVVRGTLANKDVANRLVSALQRCELGESTLFLGYPILSSADEALTVDAVLLSKRAGVVVFDFSAVPSAADMVGWREIEERHDALATGFSSKLLLKKELRKGRSLGFDVSVMIFGPTAEIVPEAVKVIAASEGNIKQVLYDMDELSAVYLRPLNAAIQKVSTIKPRKKRSDVKGVKSRGAVIKEVEKAIANLDRWQKRAAIEVPEGPQRIRGLAGSGKTVVLALKAAYLHAAHPEWSICVTFNTRSLYDQFKDLIRRFCFEHINDEPDWTKLLIIHGWGSGSETGVYAEIASAIGHPVRSFMYGKEKYGYENAFKGVCAELLASLEKKAAPGLWDALLIDEAQDFPTEFFQIAYHVVRQPKRIVWAYDELQNLSNNSMPPTDALFGLKPDGSPRVSLDNRTGEAHEDIILPICYRNTPWALATAHSVGFGVYREAGLVQLFDDQNLWNEIGYEISNGSLLPGSDVSLGRKSDCVPAFFPELLKSDDAVQFRSFEGPSDQIAAVVADIKRNLDSEELEHDDILIIFSDPLTTKSDSGPLMAALMKAGIESHLVGVTYSRDEFFHEKSIAISGIYRAKGNEAPMVYVLNANDCYGGYELIKKRNILFTAITRSRAWVRVYGFGERMKKLCAEMEAVRQSGHRLNFRVPTPAELQQLRRIHRDMTPQDRARKKQFKNQLSELVKGFMAGDIDKEDLDEDDRKALRDFLNDGES